MTTHQKTIMGISPARVAETAFAPRCVRENAENLVRVSSICRCFSRASCASRYQSRSCTPIANSRSVFTVLLAQSLTPNSKAVITVYAVLSIRCRSFFQSCHVLGRPRMDSNGLTDGSSHAAVGAGPISLMRHSQSLYLSPDCLMCVYRCRDFQDRWPETQAA